MKKYTEYESLNLPQVAQTMLSDWEQNQLFRKSVEQRPEKKPFVFFEGPPSANGLPGIHHVMARAIKDIFCRYKSLQGYRVERKAGWDTHGLPVELGVEKELGITKEDIGKKLSVEEYNEACEKAVMRYTDVWNDLTRKMGYWVDMDNPYITYKPKYMESVWWLLKTIYDKGLLYKGYTIQPYSPKAGTGLSSHELNQPGSYRDVKDTSVVAQFHVVPDEKSRNLFGNGPVDLLAWTTTPWTLPSNTALTIGEGIEYVLVESYNQYTGKPIRVVLASALVTKQFKGKYFPVEEENELRAYAEGDKKIPYRIGPAFTGKDLVGLRYEQLLPFAMPYRDADQAFRVIPGDFVTTEDGTGIVHTAPTFGADDARVAKEAGVPPMLVEDKNGNPVPLVDLQGRFIPQMGEWGGKYVKNEYYEDDKAPEKSVDVEIAIYLKERNQAFLVEKYEHSYPHCWRTDKPVLYYPLDSWFIRTTAVKDRLITLNSQINWKPASTGTGRFGNWLENLNDWNLSRSRFWGIPIPIWRTEEGDEEKCIGSVAELKAECEKAVETGCMKENPLAAFTLDDMSEDNYSLVNLHKHVVDDIVLASSKGQPMKRESDLIDVWFDSGSMPYAQWHYPFENRDKVDAGQSFPADFIAEGVDQTRGWFFTLHAIAGMCFDQPAYKNVVSNGLVLDKNGQKMSKRLGNAVDPFQTLETYGPDATRWYMISNAQPWDNLKFDAEGITEVQRKFFRALHNTYAFFALYANIDGFVFAEEEVALDDRPEIDRWIISRVNTLMHEVEAAMDAYEPTRAARLIQDFVVDDLSNWYVRLCRKRFWRGDYAHDKICAYQTLYRCLETVAILASPIAPFYTDRLFRDLNNATGKNPATSVHLADFPVADEQAVRPDLEERMGWAQRISSMVLSIRKKENLKVRTPLSKALVPVTSGHMRRQLEQVAQLICDEVNIKALELVDGNSEVFVKTAKANFKALGPRYGKLMKPLSQAIANLNGEQIRQLEAGESLALQAGNETADITINDVEIRTEDIPGWQVVSEGGLSVALDIQLTDALIGEGRARELVNRIQNLRKENGLEVTDKIAILIEEKSELGEAIKNNKKYICTETLADRLDIVASIEDRSAVGIEIDDDLSTKIALEKL